MLDATTLFEEPNENAVLIDRELWGSRENLRLWLKEVFDQILATPTQDFFSINVLPYRIDHDPRNLYSISLLSLVNLRPRDARISRQEFEYLFCEAVLEYLDFPEDEGELLISWISTSLYRLAEEEEFLDSTPADFIRDFLLYQVKNDPLLARLRMVDLSNFIPLFVSVIFAIHMGGLWSQLHDRIEILNKRRLKVPFKLLEMFLNSFAESDLRFREVHTRDVKEVMILAQRNGAVHSELEIGEPRLLLALRIPSELTSSNIVTSVKRAKNAATHKMGSILESLPGLGRKKTKTRKNAKNILILELDDAA